MESESTFCGGHADSHFFALLRTAKVSGGGVQEYTERHCCVFCVLILCSCAVDRVLGFCRMGHVSTPSDTLGQQNRSPAVPEEHPVNIVLLFLAACLSIVSLWLAPASAHEAVQIVTPISSQIPTGAVGQSARTMIHYIQPPGGIQAFNQKIEANPRPFGKSPATGTAYSTPASIGCVYKLTSSLTGCNPNTVTALPQGGSKAIAVVVAYNYLRALKDLQKFSTQFGLPAPNLTIVYATGSMPRFSPSAWEMEAALDLQWAHAMAPNAKLYLVEASSDSIGSLIAAVDKASALVAAAGGGEVSMSWGMPEFARETTYDSHFTTPNVVYLAPAGDSAETNYPCVSPNVVCVGGTTLRYNASTNLFLQEVAWVNTGGGVSQYESIPSYQSANGITGTMRQVPDLSAAADPNSGGWIYYTPSDGYPGGWMSAGGTSWATPMFAGILNAAGSFYKSSAAELSALYTGASAHFTDVSGWCGDYGGITAGTGYDQCTGIGTPVGYAGK